MVNPLTDHSKDYWGENRVSIGADGGNDELQTKIEEAGKRIDSLKRDDLESLQANLDSIPPNGVPKALRRSIYQLKMAAVSRITGEARGEIPLTIDPSAPREVVLEVVDEMLARGIDEKEICRPFEEGLTSEEKVRLQPLFKEIREKVESEYHIGEYSLEDQSSEELDPFAPPLGEYVDELGEIDYALYDEGDIGEAFGLLLEDLDAKISDPNFLLAYVYARVGADEQKIAVPAESLEDEVRILAAMKTEGMDVQRAAILDIRKKEGR